MRAGSFRLAPPAVEIPAAVGWVLRWALGPGEGSPSTPLAEELDPPQIALWAQALGLAPRLAHSWGRRVGEETLESLLGEAAGPLLAARRSALVDAARIGELQETVAGICGPSALAAVLLKGAALLASGRTAPGSRRSIDLDVLVPESAAPSIARGLEERGFSSASVDESRHHLPALAHPQLGVVELHTLVPGILVAGEPVTAERLVRTHLCEPSEAACGLQVPVAAFLRVHAAVHALGQHGLSPTVYPLLRMVADWIDLETGEGAGGASDRKRAEIVETRGLSNRELAAVGQLTRDLSAGRLPVEESDAAALVRHAVAGAADRTYHRSLAIAAACRALASGDWRKLARGLLRRGRPEPAASIDELPLRTHRRASASAILLASLGWRSR
jgi:Uncharacterised nucleotidyltransferase